jgi:protein TonB
VASVALHVLVLALVVLVPLFIWEPLPPLTDGSLAVFFYDPPPPPPPPPPLGSGLVQTAAPRSAPAPEPREAPALVAPVTAPPAPAYDVTVSSDEAGGDPEGSPLGVPEGMEGGVEGGVVGGLPGGVLGGVIGGTGTGPAPVMRPDRPPRPLRTPRPDYPQEAFVKKIEGVVLVEILIDERGHVARARVLRSVPMLDAAALKVVKTWVFLPAEHQGRPVPTIAWAPVTFTIY